jgi:hypothetical protein
MGLMALTACHGGGPTVQVSEFERYTGIGLCASDRLLDRTSDQERNLTPGFAFHVELELDRSCDPQFEEKLSAVSRQECTPTRVKAGGCFVADASPLAQKHSSLTVKPLSANRYDVRFWE